VGDETKDMNNTSESSARNADRRGFTLLEVIIAMTIAGIGLLSLALLQDTAVKGNSLSGRFTQATFLAQGMLERIKEGNIVEDGTFGPMDMADTQVGAIIDAGTIIGIDECGEKGGPFDLQWQVAANTQWSRKITVNVSWNSVLGMVRNIRLASISRGGGE